MFRKLIATSNDYAMLIVRVTLAAVMFPHGAQKLLGWWGGYGFVATVQGMSGGMGIPKPLVVLVILGESVGAVALALGLLGRVAAFGIAAIMTGAVVMVHGKVGFFMDWFGKQGAEGYEYHLLAIAMALAVMLKGSGALSADLALQRDKR